MFKHIRLGLYIEMYIGQWDRLAVRQDAVSFLVILTKSYTIPQQDLPKRHYFVRQASKPTLTRCRIITTRIWTASQNLDEFNKELGH